jgi:HAD superfamily hydrolase (TIGR02253 family)
MRKKAVLFDLDDTLYDFSSIEEFGLKESYQKLLGFGCKISYEEFIKIYLEGKEDIKEALQGTASAHDRILFFQRLVEKIYGKTEPEIALELFNSFWEIIFQKMKPFDDSLSVLKSIQDAGLRIALVSDHTTDIQLRKIDVLGFSDYFNFIATSEEAGKDKPNREIFELALHKLSLKPEDVVMVGDIPERDIAGAKRAGIESILYNTTNKPIHNKEEEPDHKITKLEEILKIVQ